MHVVYYDESGDDGFPAWSSPLFSLAAVYSPAADWRENFDNIATFKRQLAKDFNFPFQTELHTHELLLNKKPYRKLALDAASRVAIVTRYCQLAAQLSLRVITTVVVKPWIRAATFPVLDRALSYSVNRIENDLRGSAQNRFLIITDEGRVGKMRSTTRRMQRINYIPSQFGPDPYRREIRHLIEDPLPKDSRESYFIQFADMVARICYLQAGLETGITHLPSRYPAAVDAARSSAWLDILRPILNQNASRTHPYGLVLIPTQP
jgi:hypothetical protein